jgi:hypothetical protein
VIQAYQQDTNVTGITHQTLPVATEDTRATFSKGDTANLTCAVFFARVEPFRVGRRHIDAGPMQVGK